MTAPHPRRTLAHVARRRFTDDERAQALELYAEIGPARTAERTGIAKGTLESWASRAGLQAPASATTAAAVAESLVALSERKARLASDLMGDIGRLRGQLFAGCVTRKVVTISGGRDSPGYWEIADVDLDQPTFGDQRAIMTSIAIAVDKVQILTGEATERIDHRHTTPIDEELARLADDLEAAPRVHA